MTTESKKSTEIGLSANSTKVSNMLGKKLGVAIQILDVQQKALATHCQGHSLNLAIKNTMTTLTFMTDVMGRATEIISCKVLPEARTNGDIKDNIQFELLQGGTEEEIRANLKHCVTRWTVRGNTYLKIQSNYDNLWSFGMTAY